MKHALLLAMAFMAIPARTQTPSGVNFQGRLTDPSGTPITATKSITFSIWNAQTAGTQLWTETQSVAVSNGIYNVTLGSVLALSSGVFASTGTWLQIQVSPDAAMTPRLPLQGVPYAFTAGAVSAANVSGGILSNAVIASESYRKPPLRHTRTPVAYNASDAVKDSQCVSELGGNYTAANLCEVASVFSGNLGSKLAGYAGPMVGMDFNVRADSAKSYTLSVITVQGNAASGIETLTGGTYPIGCVSVYTSLRFTTTLVAYSATDAVKDGQCATEFGSSYVAANVLDLFATGNAPVGDLNGPALSATDNSFNVAGNTTHSWKFHNKVYYASSARATNAAVTGGTYKVACIRQ